MRSNQRKKKKQRERGRRRKNEIGRRKKNHEREMCFFLVEKEGI